LGHYKALLKPIDLGDTESTPAYSSDDLNDDMITLLHAHLASINYCFRHGYSSKRWKDIINVMILKEPGNTKVHCLRVIHIFEADYNLILSLKWRALLKHAKDQNLLNDGQYGSRSDQEAPALPYFEELKTEIAYRSRKPLVNMDNDTSSCYDRIIVSLASLISRKYGQNCRIILINAKTLKEAQYGLKTELRVSEAAYSHCTAFPLHGTGQGSDNSPMIWCLISSTPFDCHQQESYGAVFESPARTVSVAFSIVGFVDDTTCTSNDFNLSVPLSPNYYNQCMQIDTQLWHDLLWASGGMLELSKWSYHFLFFDFLSNGKPVPRPGTVGPPLEVIAPTGTRIPIPTNLIYNPHKTLGHCKSPAGTGATNLKHLTTKMAALSQQLATSPATISQAATFYNTIYLPSVYVLPQSFFPPLLLDAT
jgi:hypothetical protein